MTKDGCVSALIDDTDRELQRAAFEMGYRPTQEKEQTAVLDINDENTRYILPEGFRITSLAEDFDMHKYNRVLWKGFNHEVEGPAPEDEASIASRRKSLSGPHINLGCNIAILAPDGEFVSYCGTWYEPGTDYCLVEPVATDPKYRKMGLGRAAVLEAVKRCGRLGAKQAIVGSSQQFYYRIGFCPNSNETFWEYRV
ncbi:MAG: GNAT family N-acetyltransferase [Anaerolineae bacterium]